MKKGFTAYLVQIRAWAGRLWASGSGARGKLGAILATALIVVLLAVGALARSPKVSSIEEHIAAGEAALGDPINWNFLTELIPPVPAPAPPEPEPVAPDPIETQSPDPVEKEQPELVAPQGDRVTVIGDSVTLASVSAIKEALPGVLIDAKTSRFMHEITPIMSDLEASGKLRDNVVIALGTNGLVTDADVDKIVKIAGERNVVLVTAHGERSWIGPGNKNVLASANRVPNVYVADWDKVISQHPDDLARDGIHPGTEGGKRFADELVRVLTQAANS